MFMVQGFSRIRRYLDIETLASICIRIRRMFIRRFALRLLMLLFLAAPAAGATKAIKFCKLVDGTGRVLTNGIDIVDNDKITAVTTAANAIPALAEVIDLTLFTGLSCVIDALLHITTRPGPFIP